MNQSSVAGASPDLYGIAPASAEGAPPAPPPTFDAIPLSADIRKAIDELGYKNPTPVQLAVFEPATRGRSLVVQARTGTGKTAAFGLPIVDSLIRKSLGAVQALILTPTRELALQVGREIENLSKYRGTSVISIYGGAPMGKQVEQLAGGAQVVSGTPGRVLDHLRRGTLDPKNIKILVLDEADEMLSMGFAKELNAIMEFLPAGDRQGLYFSATIPPDVDRLAKKHLKDPEYITLSSDQVGALQLQHFVYLVRDSDKRSAILNIVEVEDPQSAVVFCNTKDETERVAELLKSRGYEADWLNGDLEQKERERVMQATRDGKLRFLVATDVAARGIDISHLTHVINADFPESAEQYVHRTGRTGRAGRTGTAISVVGPKDVGHLYMLRLTYKIRPIERMLPTAGEKKTRAEADVVSFLADAYAGKTADPLHLAVARRLFTHDEAASIVAGLLADHLGANGSTDAAGDAAEARRAKNPPPAPVLAPPPPAPRTTEARPPRPPFAERPRERAPEMREARSDVNAPRTLRDGERPHAGDRGRRNDRNDAHAHAHAQTRAPATEPRRDAPRPASAEPRTEPRIEPPARAEQPARAAAEQAPRAAEQPRGERGGRGRRGETRRDPNAPRDEGVRRDQMGALVGEGARTETLHERARAAGRSGIPQATLSEWEPPADDDDDSPLFDASSSSARPTRGRAAPPPAPARAARPRSLEDAETTNGMPEDDSLDTNRAPNLPGFTEGAADALPPPPRRDRGDRGPRRGPTRDRGPAPAASGASAERGPAPERERGPERAERAPRESGETLPDGRDDASLANIFLNVGRRDGATVEVLQQLLADTAGIPHAETANIRVRDRITFVTVKKELLEQAIKGLVGQVIGGRTVNAEPARDR